MIDVNTTGGWNVKKVLKKMNQHGVMFIDVNSQQYSYYLKKSMIGSYPRRMLLLL